MDFDIIIIGGCASGLMAAISCAGSGRKVGVIERREKIGKKILATGNGKCNYSNLKQEEACYRSEHPEFAWNLIQRFGVEETVGLFREFGIIPKEKNGYLYPRSEQAAAIVDVLMMQCEKRGVSIILGESVQEVTKKGRNFKVKSDKNVYRCKKMIMCTGGKAHPQLGSNGSGYDLAKMLGHSLTPILPALCALRSKEKYFKKISGVRAETGIKLKVNGKVVAKENGELQITDYGVSGIPIFQVSRYASVALYEKKTVEVVIDFFPEYTFTEVIDLLVERQKYGQEKTAEQAFIGVFNRKLISLFLEKGNIDLNEPIQKVSKEKLKKLGTLLKEFTVSIYQTNTFDQAQVCVGGVKTEEINNQTLESKLVKGLYFAGEIIDVDGTCGGYNLQWAWTSGYLAGKEAANALNE